MKSNFCFLLHCCVITFMKSAEITFLFIFLHIDYLIEITYAGSWRLEVDLKKIVKKISETEVLSSRTVDISTKNTVLW